MTHPDKSAEAMHDLEADEEKRDQHLGSENPRRVPVKDANDPAQADLPELDQDRGGEEVPERTRREMH